LKRKLLLSSLGVILAVAALALYVGINARRELNAARSILGTPAGDLSPSEVREARSNLEAAESLLRGPPAAILRLVPVARQNIQAVDAVVDAGIPVMNDAIELLDARKALGEQELVSKGRVRLEVLEDLREPLRQQLKSLTALKSQLLAHRSGWLLPPLWDTVDDFAGRTAELRSSAERATQALEIAPSLLGERGPRTYLVLLLNNAELRGAGGILSALGTISARNGVLELGEFFYYADIAIRPPERVPAPTDYERRFSRYRANTTTVVNATVSPDVPEVAAVAARLFKRIRGVKVDGALLIDPRGISALMPAGAQTPVPGSNQTLSNDNLTKFIYSDSYNLLGGADPGRRSAILTVGRAAFRSILAGGGSGFTPLDTAGDAVAGAHIRFVSFHDNEHESLSSLGLSGGLTTDSVDNLLVTVQNLGADKLDFWMRRHMEHNCSIQESDSARCETVVVLSNETPRGLNSYVTQVENQIKEAYRYGTYVGYLEIYVPEMADLIGVTLDGRTETFYRESENGRTSIGMYFSTQRAEKTTARVTYELTLPDSGYSLEIAPQPLTSDTLLKVDIKGPSQWALSGPGTREEGRIAFDGRLSGPLRFASRPAGRTGLAAAWAALFDFWTQPLRLWSAGLDGSSFAGPAHHHGAGPNRSQTDHHK